MASRFEYERTADLAIAGLTEDMLDDVAEDVLSFAVRGAAVDTGAMRRSADIDSLPGSRQIGYRVPYSAFVENGTRHMAAQPSLAPALYRHR